MVVTVYIMRIISSDLQDDAVVEWLSCCDSEELVFFYTEARTPPESTSKLIFFYYLSLIS